MCWFAVELNMLLILKSDACSHVSILDFDECSDFQSNNCDTTVSECVNVYGSYICTCYSGFHKVNETCIDVNECYLNMHDCYSPNACVNTIGSYDCKCSAGFTGDGKFCEGRKYLGYS